MAAIKIEYQGESKVIKKLCEAVNYLADHGGGGEGDTMGFRIVNGKVQQTIDTDGG